jgi:hypothetical protein
MLSELSIGNGLENKVVVVTGASSGIGRATAILFEKVGARICATARDAEGLESLAGDMVDSSRHIFRLTYKKLEHANRLSLVPWITLEIFMFWRMWPALFDVSRSLKSQWRTGTIS